MSVSWDAAQYSRFARERRQPALDLLARIQDLDPRVVHDLGCGTGEITRLLAETWPKAEVVGVDRSPEMLAKATLPSGDSVTWIQDDLATWSPHRRSDLLFSNAALHWLPDHRRLFPRLMDWLEPDGVLAVQMPLSWNIPSHELMREILHAGDEGKPFGGESLRQRLERSLVLPPPEYYEILAPSAQAVEIWSTRYFHVLEGAEPVFEWVRATGLRPILGSLEPRELQRFLRRYRNAVASAYPAQPDGRTIYPFPRLFIVARKHGTP